MTEIGCDPQAVVDSAKRPVDPKMFPDRVVEVQKRDGERFPEEVQKHSTYYPTKLKPSGVA